MSLENLKITDSKINQNGVASAPDKLTGSAAQNKEVFDNLVRKIVAKSINDVIDTLTSSAGAQSIGMNDLYGEQEGLTVFTAVEKMRLKTNADKSDKTVTDNHIKNVEHDEKTGIFKFVRENGEEIIIDTALEKISVNFSYDSDNESILIYLADGTTESVPLSSFISETDWNESDTVQFNIEQHKVSAFIKYGSITDEHLSSLLRDTLISYVTESGNSAVAAQNAADSATESASKAEKSAEYSELCAQQSQGSSNCALEYEVQAQKHASSAENSQKNAEQYASEAKTARDEAVEIAGFDPTNYVQKNDLAEINGDAGLTHLSSPTYGINLKDTNKDGIYRLIVYGAKEEQIVEKKNAFMPLTPSFIDLAVKVGLTTNTTILTDDEKTAALTWLGLMSEGIFNFDNTVGINAMLNMNGNVFQTEACEIMNGNEHYLHSGNIFQHTNTVHYTSYSGTGSVPTETSPAIIEDLPSGVHFGILMDISDGILNNAWYIDVSTADGETTFITLKDSGGNNCIVKMRYMITAPGVYDSVYRLEWYNTSNAPTAKQLMNESGRKYAFMYM